MITDFWIGFLLGFSFQAIVLWTLFIYSVHVEKNKPPQDVEWLKKNWREQIEVSRHKNETLEQIAYYLQKRGDN